MTPPSNQQFPEEHGLLWSYRLDGQGSGYQQGRLGSSDEKSPGFDWFHLKSDETDSIVWMQEMSLDEHVIEALSALDTRPRMTMLAGGVLINLRGVNTNPGSDPEDMISLRVWFSDKTIVTARKKGRKLISIEDVRARIENGSGPKSPGEFISMLTEHLANKIGDIVDSIDDDLTQIEINMDEDNIKPVQQNLSAIRLQTVEIRRYLAPQREALSELYRTRGILSEDVAYDLQYQTDRIIHHVEDLDLAKERAVVLQGELQNRLAEKQNARMFVLSIVAAIFLPLSFLTGVFGMNIAGLPGLEHPNAFNILTGSMLVLAIALIAYMRWKKWM
jgi:zinc transporter